MSDLECLLTTFLRAGSPYFSAPTELPTLSDSDWARLVTSAEREHLAALLYRTLKDSQRLDQLPRACADSLHLAYVRANIANWQWSALLDDLLAQFARANIPVVLLKGAALSVTLYTDPALRQIGDLDVLIRATDKARAGALLIANGFTPLLDLTDGFREQFGSEQCYTRRGQRAATVDLHWSLINRPRYAHVLDVKWFWAHTRAVPLNAQRVTVLDWDAQLLHLAEHFIVHHQMRGVRWSYDLALLLALHQHELHWEQILEAARRFEILPALAAVLTHIADTWGVVVPASVRAALAESRRNWAERFQVIVLTSERSEAMLLREGMSFREWRTRAAYFFHIAFPAPNYMRQRYRIAHPVLLPLFYLLRLGLGVRRLVESLATIVRKVYSQRSGF